MLLPDDNKCYGIAFTKEKKKLKIKATTTMYYYILAVMAKIPNTDIPNANED